MTANESRKEKHQMAKPPKPQRPQLPPPRKIVHRTTAGPNTGSGTGNSHAGKGNPHGHGKR